MLNKKISFKQFMFIWLIYFKKFRKGLFYVNEKSNRGGRNYKKASNIPN